jgi:class 3 adenylate cyclase/streptogramin lyase
MSELPSGTVTFLFTDIEGSTRLLKALGERYAEVLAEHQNILRRAANESGGREVDTQGDSFFFAFASARSAVAAAVHAQRGLADHSWPEAGEVRVRMGLHTGEPAVGEERYVGLGVHRAARIGAVGHGGQVLLSNATRELVEDDVGGVTVRELGAYRLKDFDRPEPLFQLDVDGLQSEFPPLNAERFVEPHPLRRRRVLAGVVAAAILIGAVVAIALARGGGSTQTVLPDSVVRVDPRTFRVTEVAQVGDAPDLIVASGGYLWVTNNILRDSGNGAIQSGGDHTLVRVDPATGKAEVVGGGLAPCGLAADPSGDVWVANCFPASSRQTSNLTRVDARTLAFKAAFSLPASQVFFRSVAYGGGFVWVSDPSGNVVQQIDPETRRRRSIKLAGPAAGLGWSGDYGDLWISAFSAGTLTRLLPATGQTNTIRSVAVNPVPPVVDGSTVWVGDWSRPDVVRLNAVGAAQPRRIRLPVRNVRACLRISCVWRLAAGAGAIWATTAEDRALWRISTKTNDVTRISLPYSPAGVASDADDVWVTVRRR